jgi:beta-lactamase class A
MAFLSLLLLVAAVPAPPHSALATAQKPIQEIIGKSGAEVSVAARTFDGEELLIEPDTSFHAASTMKIPVMIELFQQAKEGTLSLDETLLVTNSFASIVDQSPYALDPGSDSDPEVYTSLGSRLSLGRLCESMIAMSSNLATNLLMGRLGLPHIQSRVHALGADGMNVIRPLEDTKAFLKGLNNTTTARALLILLSALASGRAVDPASDATMVAILKRQHFSDAIPAGLPPGIPVAHKTGEITKIQHDAAIVYAPRPFVLVVLVRGIEDRTKSAALIAEIAHAVYAATQDAPVSTGLAP